MQIMHALRVKKGGLLASFFIILIFLGCIRESFAHNSIHHDYLDLLARKPEWHALIHFDGKVARVKDATFLLSIEKFSPAHELRSTLKLFQDKPEAYCRFPARYYWLKNYFNLPEDALTSCDELIEFEQRAPSETISLVFASENVSQPSSMMGHVLIKISGVNHTGNRVNHAISFYTDVQGFNLPKMFYDSILVGKKGFFSLTPYQSKIDRYQTEEGRNVWEYILKLTDVQKKLIQYHVYELKHTDLTYYFDDYNCATLTQFILGLTGSIPESNNLFWVTPLDTVKIAHKKGLIASTNLIPADRWKIKMLNEALAKKNRSIVHESLKNPKIIKSIESPEQRFIAYEIADSLARAEAQSTKISHADYIEFEKQLKNQREKEPEFAIDISQYKSPINTPNDSQISVGLFRYMNENFIKMDLLPAAHRLEDDNSQYFGETELTLGEISLIQSVDNNKHKLHHFTLYGVKSLMPADSFSKSLSGTFKLGSKLQMHNDMEQHTQMYVEGMVGKAYRPLNRFLIYGLVGGGLGQSRFESHAFSQLEMGFILTPTQRSKFRLYTGYTNSTSSEIVDSFDWGLEQSLFINKSWSSVLRVNRTYITNFNNTDSKALDTSTSLSVKRFF